MTKNLEKYWNLVFGKKWECCYVTQYKLNIEVIVLNYKLNVEVIV